jgi:hypothetical protein
MSFAAARLALLSDLPHYAAMEPSNAMELTEDEQIGELVHQALWRARKTPSAPPSAAAAAA